MRDLGGETSSPGTPRCILQLAQSSREYYIRRMRGFGYFGGSGCLVARLHGRDLLCFLMLAAELRFPALSWQGILFTMTPLARVNATNQAAGDTFVGHRMGIAWLLVDAFLTHPSGIAGQHCKLVSRQVNSPHNSPRGVRPPHWQAGQGSRPPPRYTRKACLVPPGAPASQKRCEERLFSYFKTYRKCGFGQCR